MYKASVTGRAYESEPYPTLDSISFNLRHKYYQTNTFTTIEKQSREKARKWSIQPSIGVGYGITTRKPDIYVGISIGYKIF